LDREVGIAEQPAALVLKMLLNFFRTSLKSHYRHSSSQLCAFLMANVLAILLMSLHVTEVDLFV
jgi:hypothetical protein